MPKKLIFVAAGGVLLALVAFGAFVAYELLGSDDANLATEAPQIPTATAGGSPAVTNTPTSGGGAAPAAGVQHYVIDSAQSTAKFVVQETLRGIAGVTTVGQTNAITGDLYISASGLAANPPSTFKVDMTKLATDSSMRDNFIRQNTLQTNRFPTADFTLTSVTGFPSSYTENTEVQLTLSGNLTIHGVTKPVTWAVKARQAGTVLTATADTDVKMTDFGMTPPDVGIAKSEDAVHIQVVLVSNRVAS